MTRLTINLEAESDWLILKAQFQVETHYDVLDKGSVPTGLSTWLENWWKKWDY